MATLTASDARKTFFDLVKNANESHEIYHIHHKSGDVVLLSEQEYESMNETLALLSAPGFREQFETSRQQAERGETLSYEEVFGEPQ